MQAMQSSACTSGMTPTANYTSNNRLSSGLYDYDQAGDVVVDPHNQYLYDAEGRICAVASSNGLGGTVMTGYLYDAEGTRVSKGAIQVWSCNPTTSQYATTSDYILGPGGEQFSEYTMSNNTMAWQHTNVWSAGRLIATYAQDDTSAQPVNGLIHFYFDDPLGTRRAQTDYAGHLEQTCSSLPFGDAETCAPTPTEHLFTGKERDTESGNDYFGARYYASSMGRFMSPDWSAKEDPVPYAQLDDPQSLNLYSYVRNNPLSRADADGHCPDACVVEGGAAVLVTAGIAVTAVIAGTAAYLHTDSGQRSFSTFTSGVSDSFSSNVSAVKSTVTGWFSKSQPAPTTGTAPAPLADDANVVRGGKPENIPNGTGVTIGADGKLNGVSVNGANGASVPELSKGLPQGTVSTTTAGQVRAAGGDVIPSPTAANPNHCTMCGITPQQAQKIMKNIPNPDKKP
jgi:RHS repeat-associated protein